MAVNFPSPIEIAIIDGGPVEALESDSEEFTHQVDEVGGDFDNDHEGEDNVLSCIR